MAALTTGNTLFPRRSRSMFMSLAGETIAGISVTGKKRRNVFKLGYGQGHEKVMKPWMEILARMIGR